VLHPFLPQTASITSSRWFLLRAHEADSNSTYLSHSLYNKVFSNAPDHFHLLPSLLSSQTSYPLIRLCCSNPHNRHLNWQFDIGIKRKLRLPLYPTTNQPICACGTVVDIFGDHIFKCKCICKIGVHNAIPDGFADALAPVLSTFGFIPPNSTVDTELILYRPSDPHSRPFNLSFDPYPAPPPLTFQAAPPVLSAQMSPSAPYLPSFPSILILLMFYKLSRPMPTHIYRTMNTENLGVSTKPTHPLLLLLGATH
jgi:hypothetical protein